MATIERAVIEATATGDTLVVAAAAGQRIVVVNYAFISDEATDVRFKSGASTNLTGPMPTGTNGGAAPAGSRQDPLLWTDLGEALNINISVGTTPKVGGHLTYYLSDRF